MTAEPLPRVLPDAEVIAFPAATLPDGTPHPDPSLAAKGWQAIGGVYQRTAQQSAGRVVLESAAACAERQPTAVTAIIAALGYADRHPSAVALMESLRTRAGLSVALNLQLTCGSAQEVASALRTAARGAAA